MSQLRARSAWAALERHHAEIGEQHLRDLFASGYRGAISLELFNREYWKRDPTLVARTGLEKMKAVVAKAMA